MIEDGTLNSFKKYIEFYNPITKELIGAYILSYNIQISTIKLKQTNIHLFSLNNSSDIKNGIIIKSSKHKVVI